MSNFTLETLIARAEIADVMNLFATSMDRRNWDLYGTIFADEVEIDFPTWNLQQTKMSASDWVTHVRARVSGFDTTYHMLSNHTVTLSAGAATSIMYVQALHYFAAGELQDMQTFGGYYTSELRHDGESWKIQTCKLTVTWAVGDSGVFERAYDRWARSQRESPSRAVN